MDMDMDPQLAIEADQSLQHYLFLLCTLCCIGGGAFFLILFLLEKKQLSSPLAVLGFVLYGCGLLLFHLRYWYKIRQRLDRTVAQFVFGLIAFAESGLMLVFANLVSIF
ncbi:MAG: hypothetical protein ACK5TN_06820 [Acidobacteriota bacterium]